MKPAATPAEQPVAAPEAPAPAPATPAKAPAPAPSPAPSSPPAPAAPAATPAVPGETVTLDKKAHDQLVKDSARASSAQSKADRYEGILKRNGLLGTGRFKKGAPAVTPPSKEEVEAQASAEDIKASQGLMALAVNKDYREVLDADPTLRDLLITNPLAVLPMLAPDALDAEDAITLVKGVLDKRKIEKTPANPEPETPAVPATPPAGGVNPSDVPVNPAVEEARKNPNVERAISGMVGARLKASRPTKK